jgi:hypothetical protein
MFWPSVLSKTQICPPTEKKKGKKKKKKTARFLQLRLLAYFDGLTTSNPFTKTMDPENLRCIESVFAPLLKLLPNSCFEARKKSRKNALCNLYLSAILKY